MPARTEPLTPTFAGLRMIVTHSGNGLSSVPSVEPLSTMMMASGGRVCRSSASTVCSMTAASLKVWMWARTRIVLIARQDIPGGPVPDAAPACPHLLSPLARFQKETQRQQQHPPAHAAQQAEAPFGKIVKREIKQVAARIIAADRRELVRDAGGLSGLDLTRVEARIAANV